MSSQVLKFGGKQAALGETVYSPQYHYQSPLHNGFFFLLKEIYFHYFYLCVSLSVAVSECRVCMCVCVPRPQKKVLDHLQLELEAARWVLGTQLRSSAGSGS